MKQGISKMERRDRVLEKQELFAKVVQMPGEPHVCKHFGCGRHLSVEESLYGDCCVEHSIKSGSGGNVFKSVGAARIIYKAILK